MARSKIASFFSALSAGLRSAPRSFPLALVVFCVLAYGLLLPGLGFYWDDWPWVWLAHLHGPQGMLQIDRQFRPLAGEILWWGALLAGESSVGWQLLNLFYRWLTGVGFWWFIRQLWPRHADRAAWAALLFTLYPGFKQQFIAINSSRHFLPLAVFLFSLGLMVLAVRGGKHRLWLWIASLLLALVAMLSTDYYYGLELVRPLALWLALSEQESSLHRRLKRTLAGWAGFLILLIGIFAWRYGLSQRMNYPVTLTGQFTADPLGALLAALRTMFVHDSLAATLGAWAQVFAFPSRADFGLKLIGLYALLATAAALLVAYYLMRLPDRVEQDRSWRQVAGLGGAALLVGGLPFLATGIQVGVSFPNDRATLPLMFGASLLLAGLLEGLLRRRALIVGLLSIALGLAVGMHFLNALSYQRDWQDQRDLFSQLSWRVPGLQPGTALYFAYNLALQNFHSTDNSLTAPLNWLYAPDFDAEQLPYMFFDLRLRSGGALSELRAGLPIRKRYSNQARFTGSTSQALVLYYAPPACLRLLHPDYDALDPLLPDLLRSALPLSNLSRIDAAMGNLAQWPVGVLGAEPARGWCYYFQQADLARQFGDWPAVAQIGKIALNLDESPHHAAELAPFIQAYAYLGEWERAAQLTETALKRNTQYDPLFCALWGDLWQTTPASAPKDAAIQEMQAFLDCQGR